MKEAGIHEGCIEQMYRLFHQKLFGDAVEADEENRIRMDDLEMREDIQKAVSSLWEKIDDNNLEECADIDGYWHDFYELFGFDLPDVDYDADVNIQTPIESLK